MPQDGQLDANLASKNLQLDPPMLKKHIKTNGFLMFLQNPPNRIKLPLRPPSWHQNLPSWLQDAPKLTSGPPTWPPRPPKMAPRSSNLASKSRPGAAQEPPRWLQNLPRWLQDPPRCLLEPPGAAKMDARHLQISTIQDYRANSENVLGAEDCVKEKNLELILR